MILVLDEHLDDFLLSFGKKYLISCSFRCLKYTKTNGKTATSITNTMISTLYYPGTNAFLIFFVKSLIKSPRNLNASKIVGERISDYHIKYNGL